MATESPLIRDGSQTVSGFDARNSSITGTTRLGPNGSGQFLAVQLSTVERTVSLTTASGANAYGILQNKPSTGIAADVGIFGISKAVAGSTAITPGLDLIADSSGALAPVAASTTSMKIARALEAATAVGQIFTVYLYGSKYIG